MHHLPYNVAAPLAAPETGGAVGAATPPTQPQPPRPTAPAPRPTPVAPSASLPPKSPQPPKPPAPPRSSTPPPASASSSGGLGALRVSLMPVDESEGKPDLRKRLTVLAIVLIALTVLIGGAYLFLAQRLDAQTRQLEVLETERAALAREIARQEAEAVELGAFAMQVTAITNRLDAQVRWSNAFDLLERLTRPEVRYESFSGNLSARTITVAATAPGFREMAEQILALRADSMVEAVRAEAGSASGGAVGQPSGVRWSMVITLSPELFRLPAAPIAATEPTAGVAPAAPADPFAADPTDL